MLERQAAFLWLVASSAVAGSGPPMGGVVGALAYAVLGKRAERGDTSAKVVAELLHLHRWSAGTRMTAGLFREALLGSALDGEAAQETLLRQASNPRFLDARMSAIRHRFEDANQQATSLTDWAERLYLLRPHLTDLALYLRRSELDGTDCRLGFVIHVESLIQDTFTALAGFTEATVQGPPPQPAWFHVELESLRRSGDTASLAELLDEEYLHRRRLPRFWYEAARRRLEAPLDPMPPSLRDIDPLRIVSIRCLEEWSEGWNDRATAEMVVNPSMSLPADLSARLARARRPIGPLDRDPGPLPHRSRFRRRDHVIIRAGVERFSLQGFTQVPPLWTAMHRTPPSLHHLPLEDDIVNVPCIGSVHDADPPWTGETTSYLETLDLQAGFLRQMATRHRKEAPREDDQMHAWRTLGRIVWERGEEHGSAYVRAMVDRWHAHRWAPGTQLGGMLLLQTVVDPGRESSSRNSEAVRIENNGTLINARIEDVQRRIEEAREKAETLTEWAEAIYLLSPRVYELRAMLDVSEGANAEAWARRFDAVGDQIIAIGSLNQSTLVRSSTNRGEYPAWTTTYLDDVRREEGTVSQTWKRLEHLFREQVTFPRFWYELALQHLDTPLEMLPAALTALDAHRVVSIDVLECWSAQLIHTLHEPEASSA